MKIIGRPVVDPTGTVDIATDGEVTSWVVTNNATLAKGNVVNVPKGASVKAANGNFHHIVSAQPSGDYTITVSGPTGTASVTVTIP